MRNLTINLSVFFFLIFTAKVMAQETCKVLIPEISASYEGPCKKGKAEGSGKAIGKDRYTGFFKDGLPSGKGIYSWENGDTYDGDWLKGKMDGQGIKIVKRAGKTDSVVNGFWKKDTYVGKYERPFFIHNQSSQISRIEVRKSTEEDLNSISVDLVNSSGSLPAFGASSLGQKTILTDVTILSGTFVKKVNSNDGTKVASLKLLEVEFPFKARYKLGIHELTVEIMEAGDWVIEAFLNN
ncbi:MORN repeat-containing protein [Daejeonella rubra]|uniref:MORN repeat-containing protein n=1 Tax=Daejeonella rubra TaxID=990371 RepID=A0A1G9VKR1_9SPHI|nr:hypothetical protein [Daejeonella rubra]SDM72706.1 MORN repeat-containing protein [Daejeonella rubra]